MTSKRRKRFLVLACLAFVLFFVFTHTNEPRYQGRSLSKWVKDISPLGNRSLEERKSARNAIRAIGTNAIPDLLEFITAEPESSYTRSAVAWLWRRAPYRLRVKSHSVNVWANADDNKTRMYGVPLAFEALGGAAAPAALQLEQMSQAHTNEWVRWISGYSLAAISTNMQPALLEVLGGTNYGVRGLGDDGYYALRLLQFHPEPAVPLLIQNLQNTNMRSRYVAAWALGEIESDSDRVLPVLTDALTDADHYVRNAATNALCKIAPQVLTNALPE